MRHMGISTQDNKMNTPRVTVLIAVYNAQAYLAEAVESVFAQSFRDWEMVLVDDGSSDGSSPMLEEYARRDERVVVHHQANKGIGSALNAGLALARGELVAILDSDDAMEPERLALQLQYLDAHPEVVAVGSQFYTMDTGGVITGIERHPIDPDMLATDMFAHFAMHHPTIMVRKVELMAAGAYDAQLRLGSPDYAAFLRLQLNGLVLGNMPQLLTRWRHNPHGVSFDKAEQQTRHGMAIRAAAFAELAERDAVAADRIATRLVARYPQGSWFDDKVHAEVADAPDSPHLTRWRDLAVRGALPDMDVQAVEWLANELPHAQAFAALLEQHRRPYLAALVRGRAGTPEMPRQPELLQYPSEQATLELELSVLMPCRSGETDLSGRVQSALEMLPEDGELLLFSLDGRTPPRDSLPGSARLRVLASVATAGAAWRQALAQAHGRNIAYAEQGYEQHPDFLRQALTLLRQQSQRMSVYAVADRYFLDALDPAGRPCRDPSPQPRWTQASLLGRDRASLGGLVHRRQLLNGRCLALDELGALRPWALARLLLSASPPALSALRNKEFVPALNLENRIMESVTRRLIIWWLDSGLGAIPVPEVWRQWRPAQARPRLRQLERRLRADDLCLHAGNQALLLEFVSRFTALPLLSEIFRRVLANNKAIALAGLGVGQRWQVFPAWCWWALVRAMGKFLPPQSRDC